MFRATQLDRAGGRPRRASCTPDEWKRLFPRRSVAGARFETWRLLEGRMRRTLLDNSAVQWHQIEATGHQPVEAHETILPQDIHLVERPDFWHPIVDLAVR